MLRSEPKIKPARKCSRAQRQKSTIACYLDVSGFDYFAFCSDMSQVLAIECYYKTGLGDTPWVVLFNALGGKQL